MLPDLAQAQSNLYQRKFSPQADKKPQENHVNAMLTYTKDLERSSNFQSPPHAQFPSLLSLLAGAQGHHKNFRILYWGRKWDACTAVTCELRGRRNNAIGYRAPDKILLSPQSKEQESYAKTLLQKSLKMEYSICGKVAAKLGFTKEDRCKSESKIRQSLLPCQHFPLRLGRRWSKHCSQIPEPQNHRTWRVKQANHRNRYSISAFEQPGPKGMKPSPAEPDKWRHQKTPWHCKHNQHQQKLGWSYLRTTGWKWLLTAIRRAEPSSWLPCG